MANRKDIADLLSNVIADPNTNANLKTQAQALSNQLAGDTVLQSDVFIYRTVVIVLGAAVLLTISGGLGLAFLGSSNYKLPAELVAIGSAAVGALAGLLAPSPKEDK
jgi:hypothetical protein